MILMSYSDDITRRKLNHRLNDLNMTELKMSRQNLADSLNDIIRKINNFQQEHSAIYYQLRFNYSYINKDLYKEEIELINYEFAELEKKFANVLNEDPKLKEDIMLIKKDLLEKVKLWGRARTEVEKDLIERRRAAFWKKTDKIKQLFTEADFNRLRELEEMYGNEKGIECLQNIKNMMSVENPSFNPEQVNNDHKLSAHSILDRFNELIKRKGSWRLNDRGFMGSKEVNRRERV